METSQSATLTEGEPRTSDAVRENDQKNAIKMAEPARRLLCAVMLSVALPQLTLALAISSQPLRAPSPRLSLSSPPETPTPAAAATSSALQDKVATTSVVGATALVAGTTVGAGILALPAKTLEAGFGPASVALIGSWAYMAVSALLIAEVNVNTLCALERSSVSMSSMARETVGEAGAIAASLAYAFIHYALLIAYMLEGGKLLAELVPALASLPPAVTPTLVFAAIGGGALLASTEGAIESANNALFAGVIASFVALVGIGASAVSADYLAHSIPSAALPALPVMVLSFTFHNVVPTIAYQLGCDLPKIRTAILAGSAIPLAMFLAWNGVVLGSVPYEAAATANLSGEIFDPLAALRSAGDSLGDVVRIFSLLAIATSFIGFCLGLVDFYADLLGIESQGAESQLAAAAGRNGVSEAATEAPPLQPSSAFQQQEQQQVVAAAAAAEEEEEPSSYAVAVAIERPLPQKAALYALALAPPLCIASWDPSLFFAALDTAGTFGILTLFGILPALMAWSQRYGDGSDPAVPDVVPGGKTTLGFMIGGAALVIGLEVAEKLGVSMF